MIKSIIAWASSIFLSGTVRKVIDCIPAIVTEVEKAMKDGKITPDERKALALSTIDIIAVQFNIKIGGIAKWIISTLIDKISAKLPSKDIAIPDIILKISGTW